jgi:hypothetical protein
MPGLLGYLNNSDSQLDNSKVFPHSWLIKQDEVLNYVLREKLGISFTQYQSSKNIFLEYLEEFINNLT